MHASSFDDLIPHMKRAGFIATTLSASITAMFGWQLGENAIASFALAGLMALCTYIVGYSLVAAHAAYKRGMKGVSFAATMVFAVSVTCEFIAQTGFNAANRDATVQKASFETTTATDARNNVKDLEAKVARLTSERNMMKPTASPAAAKATIATSEAHRFYRLTDGCKETKGPQTRAFCDAYFSAQADVSLWDQIAAQEIKLATAESELKDARGTASTKHAGHAAGASQNLVLASMFTANVNPDETAAYWSGVGISALLAIFSIAAGGLCNFVAFAFESASKPVRRAMTEVQAKIEDNYPHIYAVADDKARLLAELLAAARRDLRPAQ